MDPSPTCSLIRAFSSVTDEMPYSDKGGYITGLTLDKDQNILAVDNLAAIVKVFDHSGVFKYAFGDKVLKKPWDIFITTSGKIAVSDPGDADVKVFSKSGKYLIRSEKGMHLNYPHGMDYHPWSKETLIADRGFSCVYVHDPKGNVKQMLTEQEDERYCLGSPQYVCFDFSGNIYVTDNEDNSLVAYDTERKHMFTYGHPEDDGTCDTELNNPASVVVDKFGNIILADTGNCRVHLLDKNGKFKDYILTWEDGIGEPVAMALTEEGTLIISEGNTGVIKMYEYIHLPYVIDTRVKTPLDGGDNYDIISIDTGSSLGSDSDDENQEEGENLRKMKRNRTPGDGFDRQTSHKEFNEQLMAMSAGHERNSPKQDVKQPQKSGINQWNHVLRGNISAVDTYFTNNNTAKGSGGGIKGILKNSAKPRFDFFTPSRVGHHRSVKPASASTDRSSVYSQDFSPDLNKTVRQDTTSAHSRRSNTLPKSASSPKLQHSAGLHTREAVSTSDSQQNRNPKPSKDRIKSAESQHSVDSLQSIEKPVVIIDQFKSGSTLPRLNLLGGGARKP